MSRPAPARGPDVRHDERAGSGGRRRAHVGGEVAQWHVLLVAHGGDDRKACGCDGADDRLVAEGQEVLEAATAAGEHDHVDLRVAAELVEPRHDRARGVLPWTRVSQTTTFVAGKRAPIVATRSPRAAASAPVRIPTARGTRGSRRFRSTANSPPRRASASAARARAGGRRGRFARSSSRETRARPSARRSRPGPRRGRSRLRRPSTSPVAPRSTSRRPSSGSGRRRSSRSDSAHTCLRSSSSASSPQRACSRRKRRLPRVPRAVGSSRAQTPLREATSWRRSSAPPRRRRS